jgi:predicted unusual protein kinase regulating ubiquinone biosynthesis (AarF/ABC1/UbiB family)
VTGAQEADLGLLGRATKIGVVLTRYGLGERGAADVPLAERAKNLRSALEELGPTFAKLGQILSTRPDLVPPEFITELSTLQDRVTPMTEAEVVEVMEGELKVPWEDVFESIDPEPLAAGTIGQVHVATLEGGERVVVKVQRHGAEDEIMRDLGLLELFAEKAEHRDGLRRLVDFPSVIRHLSESLRRELDFRMEAANVDRLAEVLERYSRLDVPSVYHELSSKRLLVLGFVDGVPLRETPDVPERKDAAKQLIESYYRQVLVDGFFHADPHPGNLLWADGKVYFLDCGMVGEVDPRVRELVLLMVMAFWQEDDEFLAEIVLQLADQEPGGVRSATFQH